MRRFQNKAAESRRTLPVAILYGAGIWLLAGLIHQQWWIQGSCFLLSVAVMAELDNSNAFIRIYSRMVTVSFVMFSCMAIFLFPSMPGAIFELCFITSLYTLLRCYQDKTATGWIFYTFLLLGLGSLAYIQALWLAPAFWLLMAATIYCFSWRTLMASLLGLICPYWFAASWMLYRHQGDFKPLLAHLEQMGHYTIPADYQSVSMPLILTVGLITLLAFTGIIHFIRNSYRDKIRTRQLYYSMMLLFSYALLLLAVQPQHYDTMLRVMIIAGSPLTGHFLALTSTRITNIAFCVITGAILLLTAFNLWMSL